MAGSMPPRSSTVTTTIRLEVESAKSTSTRFIYSASERENTPAKSFTALGTDGLGGICASALTVSIMTAVSTGMNLYIILLIVLIGNIVRKFIDIIFLIREKRL
ncbi:unknown [Alistipes sp. CAG:831]|nr:unknown [Alistipes sp. CAG:831]